MLGLFAFLVLYELFELLGLLLQLAVFGGKEY